MDCAAAESGGWGWVRAMQRTVSDKQCETVPLQSAAVTLLRSALCCYTCTCALRFDEVPILGPIKALLGPIRAPVVYFSPWQVGGC